jgi:5-hydroxyisourate hydrolase
MKYAKFILKSLLLFSFATKVFAGVSVHVLNVATKKEAKDIPVLLFEQKNGNWVKIGEGLTDVNGRILLLDVDVMEKGFYKITFKVEKFIKSISAEKTSFYPEIDVVFNVSNPNEHYHIPLSLSPYSYSTYKGSYPKKM